MSDKLVGDLTNEHQRIEGSLVSTDAQISGSLSPKTRTLSGRLDGHGTRDYNHLYNKPSINGQTLVGDTTIIEDKTFVYEQSRPSSEWTVEHGLEKFPAVTVVDSAGTEVIGAIDYIDLNTVILTFVGAFSGKAFFN